MSTRQYLVTIEVNDGVPNESAEAALTWVKSVFDRGGLWTLVNDGVEALLAPGKRRVSKALLAVSVDVHHG
jgi:hypothetical protein